MKNLLSLCALIGLSSSLYTLATHENEAPCAEDHRASARHYNHQAHHHFNEHRKAKARAKKHLELARACEQHEKHQKNQETLLIKKTIAVKPL